MGSESRLKRTKADEFLVGGAFGAGAVLVVIPCVGLYFGVEKIAAHPAVGLPVLAIFGIMILFGALALIATLFARLNMQDRRQALGLPEGSIRAAIALALIVLFAIISIMLYQAVSKAYVVENLDSTRKDQLLAEAANQRNLIAVVPICADRSAAMCPAEQQRFSVHMRQPAGQESADLAKQLLILIGTLMTSVTSFYFASRALEPKREKKEGRADGAPGPDKATNGDGAAPPAGGPTVAAGPGTVLEAHVDGCDVEISEADATPDENLPAAKGGVA